MGTEYDVEDIFEALLRDDSRDPEDMEIQNGMIPIP